MSKSKAIFFQVKSTQEKLIKIVLTAQYHFEKKEPLSILVPDEKIQNMIDELLWKTPTESFLPHSTESSKETIEILIQSPTTILQKHIFNLCTIDLSLSSFKVIYELEDQTSPSKQADAQKKIKAYASRGIPVESKL